MRRAAAALLLALLAAAPPASAEPWRELAPGKELGRFALADGEIVVLRLDPQRWALTLHGIEGEESSGRSARVWAAAEGLVAATNAGMFAGDYRTHLGLLQDGERLGNPRANSYQSVAAFAPRREGIPPFRIFDLEDAGLDQIRRDYARVVQNLRLVKRPGENRWSRQERRWSEAALGEDREGRALFIFSRAPRTMYDLIETLLALPLGLVAAQHLEGGEKAQLWVDEGTGLELVGVPEGGRQDQLSPPWPLPNVIGVRPVGGH